LPVWTNHSKVATSPFLRSLVVGPNCFTSPGVIAATIVVFGGTSFTGTMTVIVCGSHPSNHTNANQLIRISNNNISS
jgi:hypothetical protein